ncbi:L-aspartate oxidase [Dysgonomonas sp. PH5-45]|uniref:L-aspartate oxidase n=1 Tax=unclassified Dysgonomonas TaxID=2630389 RepID=UPI0024763F78|nr:MULTISPECIES: L-aspartate oxidase [unclassified Dysgonomonas]MDH6355243.1 L-aspartate oxidase [Dysgonomonas sp. PH5-45]MDH6388135.1 L-aspartate oxidase [Dysgonomonas sp. PH5-37]
MIYTDVLVIGSGISGLSYALKIAQKKPDAKITVLTKSDDEESNTKYAQGGVAVVTNFETDSFEKHIADTLRAGDGLCKKEAVEVVVKEGPERVREIVEWGANFDKNNEQTFDLGREGGHTENRVVHYKDITGAEIERALLEAVKHKPNIELLNHHYVIDLITEHHVPNESFDKYNLNCYGAYVLNLKTGRIKKMSAKITLMATGGCGHVYKNTTNPLIATGDGIGLAHRAKAKISNMQFIQFHPTAFYSGKAGQLSLISEAVRGFGAKLRTVSGEPFMHKYDEREELASRDIVARAIDNEMKLRGDDHVCLDCRHLDHDKFMAHFPNIYQQCKDEGLDMFNDLIPVVPACHYLCGGIEVDLVGQSTIKNMFAVGECSNTGLHGANRLASNSLLEALVFGHRAAMKTVERLAEDDFNYINLNKVPEWNQEGMRVNEEMVLLNYLRKELQTLMSDLVGIVRSNARLKLAKQKEEEIYRSVKEIYNFSILSPQLSELRNLVSVAFLIITQSIEQNENRGAFYNKDLDKNA